jgi:hypothetical protein
MTDRMFSRLLYTFLSLGLALGCTGMAILRFSSPWWIERMLASAAFFIGVTFLTNGLSGLMRNKICLYGGTVVSRQHGPIALNFAIVVNLFAAGLMFVVAYGFWSSRGIIR